jgi:lipoprotein-releasing system ATP-binding protein
MNDVSKNASEVLLSCSGLGKRFDEGRLDVTVLRGVDLQVRRGETVAVVGASGSGKSTFLRTFNAMEDFQ